MRFVFSYFSLLFLCSCFSCTPSAEESVKLISLDRTQYENKLEGFWLGTCIANWTGLVTEMDKIGNIGEIKTGDFYTREDWGAPDQPSIWSEGVPSDLSPSIDFVLRDTSSYWGADDDTDIEYIYQEVLWKEQKSRLEAEDIRNAWLKHISVDEENYLWVSNQRAFDLMREGVYPPETSAPDQNEHYDMIDAQLTTELIGLLSPLNDSVAVDLAQLPIAVTAREEAASIAAFYVSMFSLAHQLNTPLTGDELRGIANHSRKYLLKDSYATSMYDFVLGQYDNGVKWESCRDSLYQRYQVEMAAGYDMSSRALYCNGCFAAGINFGASLISLFYGEGDFKETIKIAVLAGWDSDNPAATWGGLLGFIHGKDRLLEIFPHPLSNQYYIHRTRKGFENGGMDDFTSMAQKGIAIIDKVVVNELKGTVIDNGRGWLIPVD